WRACCDARLLSRVIRIIRRVRARCDSNMQNSARGSVPPGVTTPSQMALKTKKEPSAALSSSSGGRGYAADGKTQYLRRGKWLTLQAMRTHNGRERRSAP